MPDQENHPGHSEVVQLSNYDPSHSLQFDEWGGIIRLMIMSTGCELIVDGSTLKTRLKEPQDLLMPRNERTTVTLVQVKKYSDKFSAGLQITYAGDGSGAGDD